MEINRIQVSSGDNNIRLDRWFRRYHPNVPFIQIAKLARTGQIRRNGGRIKASDKLATGDELRFPDISKYIREEPLDGSRAPISDRRIAKLAKELESAIIYKDADIIVINKPTGIAAQGGSKVTTSIDVIARHWKFDSEWEPRLVHRLDKETSGIMVLARSPQVAASIAEAFRHKKVQKTYIAVLCGVPKAKSGVIKAALGKEEKDGMELMRIHAEKVKNATTEYRVLDFVLNKASLVEFTPITGRTHQIRVHSLLLGHPILGDDKYGKRIPDFTGVNQRKMHLHAYSITLELNGKKMTFTAPLPPFFQETISTLGFEKFP